MRYPHGLETPISRYTKSIGYGWSDQVSAASKPLHCSGGSSDCSRAARHGWKCGWVHHGSTKFTAIPLVKDHLPMNLVDHQMGGSGGHAPFSDESSPCGIVRGIRDSSTWDSVIYGSWGSFRKNGWPSNFHGFFPMFPIFFFSISNIFSMVFPLPLWVNWSFRRFPRREMQQLPYDEAKEGVIRAPDYAARPQTLNAQRAIDVDPSTHRSFWGKKFSQPSILGRYHQWYL